MANLGQMMQDLKAQRSRVEQELRRLNDAIGAVAKLSNSPSAPAAGKKSSVRRRLSAAARKRIADAQRARWAKVRKQKAAKAAKTAKAA